MVGVRGRKGGNHEGTLVKFVNGNAASNYELQKTEPTTPDEGFSVGTDVVNRKNGIARVGVENAV
jgi:hypothetical protein